ncbi:transcriptional regulator family: Centromere protein B DNA-binding region [Penicillium cosmopolitanum]|uniref:Transcriptional regulator family: Centromere protein B DNA-binding region n=1 Tax=Penicillium cosmopolitanum TaxID=1131564 RepID=A0A9W9WBR3_9EURO|nr:transcriptional regulator family: Centromere protein B DNA-binding region [Penicillium cosmopolitanum]KAJ5414461.1 transcriptional regulator family: Centromere protein B DNA-binding region [Penicillium cosmopolitanum]
MPKSSKTDESRVSEACKAANALKKPNISRIARDFGVPYQTLYRRIRKGRTLISGRKPTNIALTDKQEQALVGWVLFIESVNIPIAPAILSHKTHKFIQTTLDYNIIPFCFYAHSTYICQPLDRKPFLALKQYFKKQNNLYTFWSGKVAKKSEFLRIISKVRATA